MIEIGKYNQLSIIRKSDLGYMLTDGKQEILMHFKETSQELNIGDQVRVFVYTDKENRPTATMNQPFITYEKFGFVEVVAVMEETGVFVFNNTPKDLLISKDYLPYQKTQWPIVGDKIFCGMKMKKNTLVAKPCNRFDILSLHILKKYQEQEQVEAYVLRITEKGIGCISKDLIYIFIPLAQMRKEYRLGQQVLVTITKMLDKEAYGTLNQHKEILMDTDKELILSYLRDHQGFMPLTAKSSSEEIEKILRISRKAFKRAYGALYKEQKIEFDDSTTYLKKL